MVKRERCLCRAAGANTADEGTVRGIPSTAATAPLGVRSVEAGSLAILLQLQRLMGNRVARNLVHGMIAQSAGGARPRIQRKKLTDEERALDLQSEALKNDARLQQAYDNSPLLSAGETSPGVKTLQRALRGLGYALPVSFAKTGDADGIFGPETPAAVLKFQTDHKLVYKDGIVGRETLGTMDQLLGQAPPPPVAPCRLDYRGGTMSDDERRKFVDAHFEPHDRAPTTRILDDLCAVEHDRLSFATEAELRDEIMMRLRIGQYMQSSQTSGGFAYPESAKSCPGKTGHPLLDAQVNADARAYWRGPILEQRAAVRNSHYFFELTPDVGIKDAYQALKLLFTPRASICDKTLIHCDTLITMTKALAYAETIGPAVFNQKVAAGRLSLWLTYDGMSMRDNDKAETPEFLGFRHVAPSSEKDLVIGDHVIFWNHLAYDAISVKRPGPWRLENALIVDQDGSGRDLFEGHGAPAPAGTVKPGPKEDVQQELMNAYSPYATEALAIAARVDRGEAGASDELTDRYPQVVASGGRWWVKELDSNSARQRRFYELRALTGPDDPEIVGLRNPDDASRLNWVKRPVESK